MRSWKYALLAIIATATAVGIQYVIRTQFPRSGDMDTSSALKPSFYRMSAKAQADNIQYRKLAAEGTLAPKQGPRPIVEPGGRGDDESEAELSPVAANPVAANDDDSSSDVGPKGHSLETETGHSSVSRDDLVTGSHKPEPTEAEPESHLIGPEAHQYEEPVHFNGTSAASKDLASHFSEDPGQACGSIEYHGDGAVGTHVSDKEWASVLSQFHDVKAGILNWLDHHRKGFAEKSVQLMEKQVQSVKLDKPPIKDEPDISWRGIGVFTYSATGAPEIRIGDGFVKLALKEPKRSKFEFARLLVQSVAPCEMIKLGAGSSWDPLQQCLGINESQACSAGTYSEAGWAISSALASVISPPGCSIPAFSKPEAVACLRNIPLPFSVAMVGGAGK